MTDPATNKPFAEEIGIIPDDVIAYCDRTSNAIEELAQETPLSPMIHRRVYYSLISMYLKGTAEGILRSLSEQRKVDECLNHL